MKKKGTILYFGGFELPDKNAAAHRVISNGKILRDLGYSVVFDGITKEPGTDSNNAKIYFDFNSYSQKYPNGFINWLNYTVKFNRYVKLIKKYSDVSAVICYNFPSGSLYRLMRYCKKRHIKIIADCTEWYDAPKEGNYIRRYAKRLDVFLRMQILNPRLDGIISISEYLNNFYLQNGAVSVEIPPLVDMDDSKWRYMTEPAYEEVHILYAGSPFSLSSRSSIKDRIDLIIRAFAELKKEQYKFKLHIAGVSEHEVINFFPDLELEIETLRNDIKFYGRIPHEHVVILLKECDYAIFLRDENRVTLAGFPTKFVESISSGTPVLTNRNSNLNNYLQEGSNGFWIDMDDVYTLKESLKRAILTNREKIQEMKNNCFTSKLFDYRRYIYRFSQLLN